MEIQGKYCKDIKVFTNNIEESAVSLIYEIADNKVFEGAKIRIMPDVHTGNGIVIGFTCQISMTNTFINPSHIGVDIGCGIEAIFFDKPLEEKKYPQFERKLKKEIPFGFDINKTSQFEMKEFIKFMNSEIQKAYQTSADAINYISFSTEKDLENWCKGIGMDYGMFVKSIGSVGGGNHFIEYDVNEEKKKYALTIHTGSRNLGQKVFKKWSDAAKKNISNKEKMLLEIKEFVSSYTGAKENISKEIEKIKEKYNSNNADGYLSGEALKGYLTDMVIAQAYAKFNREIILRKAAALMNKINGARVIDRVSSVHNYLDFSDMMIRKGAIRAHKGEKMIIPFNMKDGLAICEGKSNDDWNCSAPHGAGRVMSRAKAKKELSLEAFQKEMNDAGIYSTSVCQNTIDEAPEAYKSANEIAELIKDTCDILFFMKPKINIKSTTETKEYGKS